MATVNIVLQKRPNRDNTHALALRVTKDRKSSYIFLGQSIPLAAWDEANQRVKKSHPNSARLNNFLLKKKAEATDKLLELATKATDVSSRVVTKEIKPKEGSSFFAQAAIYVENLRKSGKYNRHKTEEGRVERFREYLDGQDITFPEITVGLLNGYRAWLKATRGIKERTIINHLLTIRTVYNQAIKSHLIDNKTYPFGKDRVAIKFPDSVKLGLNAEEVKILEDMELTGYPNHARNVWLISFYFAGMRLADVMRLKWSDFHDGRLHYAMSKNLKVGSLKVPDKAAAILESYRDDAPKHDFVFPELKVLDVLDPYEVQRKIAYAGQRMDKALKKIAKEAEIKKTVSLHIARHSFAQLAGDKVSVQVLQLLYRHSNIMTTIRYQGNFATQKTDQALDTVLNF
jgi:site-specific recombinase XerD